LMWILFCILILLFFYILARVVDPDSLNTDPDPAFLLNPVPDPDPS
jgi:hypothetical protein